MEIILKRSTYVNISTVATTAVHFYTINIMQCYLEGPAALMKIWHVV